MRQDGTKAPPCCSLIITIGQFQLFARGTNIPLALPRNMHAHDLCGDVYLITRRQMSSLDRLEANN